MCGIAGVISLDGHPLAIDRLKPMVDAIRHRGPDDAGYVLGHSRADDPQPAPLLALTDREFAASQPGLAAIDGPAGQRALQSGDWTLFLGNRRLAIIDLTPAGHQPMGLAQRGVWLTYNGETYNFRELRGELESQGRTFTSHSDAEVVLQAYAEWGIDCVRRLNGMFAFALWDGRRGELHLVRDRYGIKPLYYANDGGALIFGSEIKALLAYLDRTPSVDLLALNQYFSFQNVFCDRTLFEGVRMLDAGTVLTVDVARQCTRTARYWDFDFSCPIDEPEPVLCDELYRLVESAVRRHCVSDVPVGSYLSGGLDSAMVTSVAARERGRIHTFTLGFDLSEAAAHEQTFDERQVAEGLASALQTEHYECVLHAGDMEPVMDDLIWALEDLRVGQCYPNYYVAKLASRFVKVTLSGVGGDELFGGYPWRYAAALGETEQGFIRNYYRYWKRLVSDFEKRSFFNDRTQRRLRELLGDDPFKAYTLDRFTDVLGGTVEASTPREQVQRALYFESKTFLHGLLVVEDKLAMSHSLESRTPYLDNELVDFACRIPVEYKIRGINDLKRLDENLLRKKEIYTSAHRSGKGILRRAAERLLPPGITGGPKQGFSAPDESWFRGRAEAFVRRRLLDPEARLNAFLNPQAVRSIIDEHCSGRANRRLLIWSLLSFETWLRLFL